MKAWWSALQPQERTALSLAAAVVSLAVYYLFIASPLEARVEKAKARLQSQQALLAWLDQASVEARDVRFRGVSAGSQSRDDSLLSVVNATTDQAGIGKSLRRVTPQSDKAVRLRVEQVAFDDLIHWIQELGRGHGIQVIDLVVTRDDQAGIVQASLTLSRDPRE